MCSCIAGYVGSPPTCRPECTSNSECSLDKACQNNKCRDPCPGTCGSGARCTVVSHNPFCTCPPGYTGDPFTRCQHVQLVVHDEEPKNPCQPSPCGPNAKCTVNGDSHSCSCLPEFTGSPPYCRPECISNSECASNLACIGQKCKDPCPGLCGVNAECRVFSHTPMCVCLPGYSGDPFVQCETPRQPQIEYVDPCNPSPCGTNAECKTRNKAATCLCLRDYFGDPYQGCRPECVVNSDCPSNKACVQNKCKDPCPGTCGQNAECYVRNHLATCNCLTGYSGDPYRYCNIISPREFHLPFI